MRVFIVIESLITRFEEKKGEKLRTYWLPGLLQPVASSKSRLSLAGVHEHRPGLGG